MAELFDGEFLPHVSLGDIVVWFVDFGSSLGPYQLVKRDYKVLLKAWL
jgi:hypothetical protein